MGRFIFGCIAVIAAGLAFGYLFPQLLALGLLLTGIASVALVQSILLGIVSIFVKPGCTTPSAKVPEAHAPDVLRLLWAYGDFKVFLGRVVGIVGMVYGILAGSAYFAVLGAVVTVLFWILDYIQKVRIEEMQDETVNANQFHRIDQEEFLNR